MHPTTALPVTRALLFGLNYKGRGNALYGCINDAKESAAYLSAAIPGAAVRVLDDETHPEACTRSGMLHALQAFVDEVNADPTCGLAWIHYSGHGSSTRDVSGDESDGMDECLVPVSGGVILDDELLVLLQGFRNPALRVVCVIDACHSGTMGDLPYTYRVPGSGTTPALALVVPKPQPQPPLTASVVMFSACLDTQCAGDAWGVLEGKKEAGGALTGTLLNVLATHDLSSVGVAQVAKEVATAMSGMCFAQVLVVSSSAPIDDATRLVQ